MIVVGVGNDLRRDDGAGPAVIAELRGRCPDDVTLAVCDGEPARLIDLWDGHALAVIVDAVRIPGSRMRVLELDSVEEAQRGTSSHALGLGSATRLAEALGRMPDRLKIYAITGTDFGVGPGLSPWVASAVQRVAGRILDLVRSPDNDGLGRP